MRRDCFNGFKAVVETADASHDIWWQGYLWLDLTEKQMATICQILATKQEIVQCERPDGKLYRLPSGITIKA